MQLPEWLSSMGQVATAACVSLVVILGVQNYSNEESSATTVDTLPVLQTVPLAGSVEPVSLTRSSLQEQNNSVNLQEQHRRVNSMLRDYELQLRLNSERSTGESDIPKTVVE
jgi:sigma-E factor negative regulatory protein RseA